jgi:hypothetical protein
MNNELRDLEGISYIIDNVKLNSAVFLRVLDSKEEPLGMT